MTNETDSVGLLSRLTEADRENAGRALRRLLANGSILGLESGDTDLYFWSYLNRELLEQLAMLLELRLQWDHQDRTVQAIPISSAFLLRLKLDATLVLLVLWYEFDSAVRDRGEAPPIRITSQQLNDSLAAKFDRLGKHIPSQTRLREILTMAQRKNLVRSTFDPAPERWAIEVLPTLKRVIPFRDLAEWNAHAASYSRLTEDVESLEEVDIVDADSAGVNA